MPSTLHATKCAFAFLCSAFINQNQSYSCWSNNSSFTKHTLFSNISTIYLTGQLFLEATIEKNYVKWYGKKKRKKKAIWVPASCFSHGNVYFKVLPSYAECHLRCLQLIWRLQWMSLFSSNESTATSKASSWPKVEPRWAFPFKQQNSM